MTNQEKIQAAKERIKELELLIRSWEATENNASNIRRLVLKTNSHLKPSKTKVA